MSDNQPRPNSSPLTLSEREREEKRHAAASSPYPAGSSRSAQATAWHSRGRAYTDAAVPAQYPLSGPSRSAHRPQTLSIFRSPMQADTYTSSAEAARKKVRVSPVESASQPPSKSTRDHDYSFFETPANQSRPTSRSRTLSSSGTYLRSDEDETGYRPTASRFKTENVATRSSQQHSKTAIESATAQQHSGSQWDMNADVREQSTVRRQNTACDACRNRKVRCHRVAGEEKCAHCKAKGIDCTTIFVQMASSATRKAGKRSARPPTREGTAMDRAATPSPAPYDEPMERVLKFFFTKDADYVPSASPSQPFTLTKRLPQPVTAAETRLNTASARLDLVSDLLETYFSIVHIRYPIIDAVEFRRRFHHPSRENGGPPADVLVAVMLAWGAKFSENPVLLSDRSEAVHDLTPQQMAVRQPATYSNRKGQKAGGINLIDDQESKSRFASGFTLGRSRIAEEFKSKAVEVLDRNKVHRVATLDNVRAALIIEALLWKPASDQMKEIGTSESRNPDQRNFLRWLQRPGLYISNGERVMCAIHHLVRLQMHQQETIDGISDPGHRSQVAMCWWLACMMDAHMSAFYRRKPMLSKEDYSTNLPEPIPSPEQHGPHPLASESAYRIWVSSSEDQVENMRKASQTLWTPAAIAQGVSIGSLEELVAMAFAWREKHLSLVGAPSPTWPPHWNFADSATACSSDMNYHMVWILMWQAIEENGIAELNVGGETYNFGNVHISGKSAPPSSTIVSGSSSSKAEAQMDQSKIRALRDTIYDEALNAALRTAHLSQILSENGYLRLDAGIMRWAINEAGFCLLRFRRPEVQSVIEALRQYGQAFEECYEQADELEMMAREYMRFDYPHASPVVASGMPTGMAIDAPPNMQPSLSSSGLFTSATSADMHPFTFGSRSRTSSIIQPPYGQSSQAPFRYSVETPVHGVTRPGSGDYPPPQGQSSSHYAGITSFPPQPQEHEDPYQHQQKSTSFPTSARYPPPS